MRVRVGFWYLVATTASSRVPSAGSVRTLGSTMQGQFNALCVYVFGKPQSHWAKPPSLSTYHRDVVGKSGRATNAGACRVLVLGCDNRQFPSAVSRFCEVLLKLAETKDKAPVPRPLSHGLAKRGSRN